jgi:hypothetical protein
MSQTELPTVVFDGEESVTVHCDVDITVLSESVTLPGLAVTVSVGVLPQEALALSISEPTVAVRPLERLSLMSLVVSVSVPVPALQVALAVSVIDCEEMVAAVPFTTAVPLTVAVNVSCPFEICELKTETVASIDRILSSDRLSGIVC